MRSIVAETYAPSWDAKVRDLHNIWAFGSGFLDILTSGRSFNFVALAGLAVTLVPINGPLLQRSTIVKEETRVELKNLMLPSAWASQLEPSLKVDTET